MRPCCGESPAKSPSFWFMKAPKLSLQNSLNPSDLTRRNFLQGLGCLVAVAGLPAAAKAAEESNAAAAPPADPTVINKLTAYMSAAANHEVPAEATEKTKHHILDTLAAMVSAADLPPAIVALKFARLHAADKVATLV